jgi:hypothetical protein
LCNEVRQDRPKMKQSVKDISGSLETQSAFQKHSQTSLNYLCAG